MNKSASKSCDEPVKKMIIWGGTGQAIVLEELLSHTSIILDSFFENNENILSPVKNIPIHYGHAGFESWLSSVDDPRSYYFMVAIGGDKGEIRSGIYHKLKGFGLQPYTAIHPTAFVAYNSVLGSCVQILANSSVCAKVHLGDNVIINTSASVDHECFISENVHIAPGAKLAGCIRVGKNSFIGAGATVLPRITIGDNVTIGAGSVVTKNIPNNVVAYGNPCTIKKLNKS